MEKNKRDSVAERFAQMILTEVIMLSAILLAAVVIRYVLPDRAGNIVRWYQEHFRMDTDVSEVISQEESHAV